MNKWDTYFKSHYMPLSKRWGEKDLDIWKSWYTSWINYIDEKINFNKSLSRKPLVLEVGSAIGAVAALLEEKGWNITGSDISREMVKAAGVANKKVRFIFCDVQKKIPGTYNTIIGFEVLEHVPKIDLAIKNIKNALKKDGYFIGSSPYPYKKAYTDPTHCNVMYPHEWQLLFQKAKFKNVQTYPMSFFPFLWRIHRSLNVVLPFYVPFPAFVSTTLIIAKK